MPEPVRTYEQQVEYARSKLTDDLATLRSPATFAAFTQDLKAEAIDTKDEIIEKAKSSAQSTVNGLVEDLKAKAAANPAAALAIGAGVAWRLLQNPPIATTLIGIGLFSLLRTPTSTEHHASDRDYFEEGKARLREQVSDLASDAKGAAALAGEAIAEKTSSLAESAKATTDEWAARAAGFVGEAGAAATSRAEAAVGEAKDAVLGQAARVAANASQYASDRARHAGSTLRDAARDQYGDKWLLGLAGIAVAAALGMAVQKRLLDVDRD